MRSNEHPKLIPRDIVLLSSKDCARIVGMCPRTIIVWSQTNMHGFPQPAIDGYRDKRWHPDDIQQWLKSIRST